MSNASLIALHTALIDARNGYREAAKDAADPSLKSLFDDMIALHERAHRDVHTILLGRGQKPTDEGSFMSTVHETVIAVRSAVAGLDGGSLFSFANGEERNVAAYDKAIEENATDPGILEVLRRERSALQSKIGLMKNRAT